MSVADVASSDKVMENTSGDDSGGWFRIEEKVDKSINFTIDQNKGVLWREFYKRWIKPTSIMIVVWVAAVLIICISADGSGYPPQGPLFILPGIIAVVGAFVLPFQIIGFFGAMIGTSVEDSKRWEYSIFSIKNGIIHFDKKPDPDGPDEIDISTITSLYWGLAPRFAEGDSSTTTVVMGSSAVLAAAATLNAAAELGRKQRRQMAQHGYLVAVNAAGRDVVLTSGLQSSQASYAASIIASKINSVNSDDCFPWS